MEELTYLTNETRESDTEMAVTGQREITEEFVSVPRKLTKEMLEAAWADALAEDAEGVWRSMVEAYLSSMGKSASLSG